MNQDDFLRHIASSYVEQYGEQLKRERDALEQSGPAITPGLDRKMKRKLNGRKRTFGAAGLVAACLLLMLIAPRLLQPARDQMEGAATTDDAARMYSTEGEADWEEAYDEDMVEEEAEYEYETAMDDAYDSAGGLDGVIPISFALPYGLSVEDVELDQGQTVYRLQNTMLDDVVMTMEYAETVTVGDGMAEIDLGPTVGYAEATADYNKLALEWDGIEYVLTCKYDINTLVTIGYSIVI